MADDGIERGLGNKIVCFGAITGIDDPDLCAEILTAHHWDLDLAISSLTPTPRPSRNPNPTRYNLRSRSPPAPSPPESSTLAWRLVSLPFHAVSGALSLVSGAVAFGFSLAGGALSRSLNLLGLPNPFLSSAEAQAAEFITAFNREYARGRARIRPNFVADGFRNALQISQRESKLLFVYLHSPDHPGVREFCSRCLCSAPVAEFLNVNCVAWGGSIDREEGFKMSKTLKASRFPFCALVRASPHQRSTLHYLIEGPRTPEEMLSILQHVVEEYNTSLVEARLEEEERRINLRLREEQDAALRAAIEADKAREHQRKEEQERLKREAAEAEQKRKEEAEALERAACEAEQKQAAVIRRRQEKAMALGEEPERGPDVTQVLVRFPNGERKERRFQSSATVESLYNYVDSLDCLNAEKYCLISNFPRVAYGPGKLSISLKEAGLHPQASLFLEIE